MSAKEEDLANVTQAVESEETANNTAAADASVVEADGDDAPADTNGDDETGTAAIRRQRAKAHSRKKETRPRILKDGRVFPAHVLGPSDDTGSSFIQEGRETELSTGDLFISKAQAELAAFKYSHFYLRKPLSTLMEEEDGDEDDNKDDKGDGSGKRKRKYTVSGKRRRRFTCPKHIPDENDPSKTVACPFVININVCTLDRLSRESHVIGTLTTDSQPLQLGK